MKQEGAAQDRGELAARLALLAAPGLKAPRVISLIEGQGSAIRAFRALRSECGAEVARDARSQPVRVRVRRALHAIESQGIRVIAFDDAAYPELLRARLDDGVPPLLFAIGDLTLLRRPAIAVVGSRSASAYGLDIAGQIGNAVGRAGACLISGLARGIDAAAHTGALEAGGCTIAVLGCGVDVYYPHSNIALQDRIASAGLLLSEVLPGEPPRKFQFPHRNRIIAALSNAVVVVEAGERSGAISTAVHAMAQGVAVYGVPNAVDQDTVQGILALYRDGIPPYTGIRDLMESAGLVGIGAAMPDAVFPETPPAGRAEAVVWEALGSRPAHIDAIAATAGVDCSEALAALLQLELDGRVTQLPGGRFERRRSGHARPVVSATASEPAGMIQA
ncbi:DNA-processing protein DprA [soil metagenome]